MDNERFQIIEKFLIKHSSIPINRDMPYAISYARAHNIPIDLIDKPGSGNIKQYIQLLPLTRRITIACRRVLRHIAFILFPYEFILYSCKKIVTSFNQHHYSEEKHDIPPSTPRESAFYNSLMRDREIYMVNKLESLSHHYDNIVAVVGNAHLSGISNLLTNSTIHFRLLPLHKYFNEQLHVKSLVDFKIHKILIDFLQRMVLFLYLIFILKTRIL